ncbi:hypothetical protein COU16_01775 [Candidatus Kaiserbacteria bacterium CG10_big_fil_rev_8_21_14_0_10_47_16]|uniref:Uncharacterized protein n=1 Tax=Candidatus Kaiserbacteria bacterium CG10_big_fil_rev_8_21_14_0_10_47_16 TaxID=1974608 RepID=A0A2H0UD06_9BACT|nr:MAG: hypothetical protein COU16_01775 [Candidatus Kaiserbacteria bacterium CG10_big_fil_rev_8_21_14_0_10_47_16]
MPFLVKLTVVKISALLLLIYLATTHAEILRTIQRWVGAAVDWVERIFEVNAQFMIFFDLFGGKSILLFIVLCFVITISAILIKHLTRETKKKA